MRPEQRIASPARLRGVTGSQADEVVRDDALLSPLRAAQDGYAGWYRLALLMTGDPQRAEDVVQDVVVSLLAGPERTLAPAAARAYVRTAVVNRSRSVHRRAATERKHLWRQRVDETGPDHGDDLAPARRGPDCAATTSGAPASRAGAPLLRRRR